MLFKKRFKKDHQNNLEIRISEDERHLLGDLINQLREVLLSTSAEGSVEASIRRLFPTAYNDDPKEDAEYQRLMRDQLLEQRLQQLDRVEDTLKAEILDDEQTTSWLTVINDLRLVLGTKLDVSDNDNFSPGDPDSPDNQSFAVYHYLGYLQGEFVEALSK